MCAQAALQQYPAAFSNANLHAVGLGACSFLLCLLTPKRISRYMPGSVLALVFGTSAYLLLGLGTKLPCFTGLQGMCTCVYESSRFCLLSILRISRLRVGYPMPAEAMTDSGCCLQCRLRKMWHTDRNQAKFWRVSHCAAADESDGQ